MLWWGKEEVGTGTNAQQGRATGPGADATWGHVAHNSRMGGRGIGE